MSVKMIQDRLEEYQCRTEQEEENAVKEIIQEICLAGLSRAGFFKEAIFQGGTCLRILYGLSRFSEDLDFILRSPNLKFEMKFYLQSLAEELKVFGFDVELQDRSRADEVVKKAFIKDDSWGRLLQVKYTNSSGAKTRKIKVKIEVDTNPPEGSGLEEKILDFPFPFTVLTQDLPSLFAGKSHALLCRKYIKGRDWYDFLYYVRKKTIPNYLFLQNALQQMGPWQGENISIDGNWYKTQMSKRIQEIDWPAARRDVQRFLKEHEKPPLELWSENFFMSQLEKLTRIDFV
jgi:predicted nucleotidyltransferase component of viral defense system